MPRRKFEHHLDQVVVGMQFDDLGHANRMTDRHRRQIEFDGRRRGRGYSHDNHGRRDDPEGPASKCLCPSLNEKQHVLFLA